jgi:transcriptional regulator with XRE-family HTH domain
MPARAIYLLVHIRRFKKMNSMKLGEELASRRRAAGLTQAELASRMGTSQAAISKIESGRVLPGLLVLERLAQATGRPLELILGARSTLPSRSERRRRVRKVLGASEFNPWERAPTPAEAASLLADGLTHERFEGAKASLRSRG